MKAGTDEWPWDAAGCGLWDVAEKILLPAIVSSSSWRRRFQGRVPAVLSSGRPTASWTGLVWDVMAAVENNWAAS